MKNTYKYTYNGKVLIKNSKNPNYKYACIHKVSLEKICVSTTAKGAKAELNTSIRECNRQIENATRALRAIKAGKKKYFYKADSRYEIYETIDEPETFYIEVIEENKKRIERLNNNYIIVEIEKSEN